MKIALYIEDGLEQIVLTPQSKTEAALLEKLTDGSRVARIHRGKFYHCQGGWVRHGDSFPPPSYADDERSSIIVLRPRDTDGSPKGTDPKGLDGEAATAGAEGIAQTGDA